MATYDRGVYRALVLGAVLALGAGAAELDQGIQSYKAADYGRAEQLLNEFLADNPGNMQARYYLGLTQIELKKYAEAQQHLEKAAGSVPDAKAALGRAYMMQEKLDEAMRTLDEAAKDQPSNAAIYRDRGAILIKRNQFDASAKQLARAIELDPKDAYSHYYYGMANSRLRRTDLMIKHFQLFLQLAPDAPEAEKVRSLLKSL